MFAFAFPHHIMPLQFFLIFIMLVIFHVAFCFFFFTGQHICAIRFDAVLYELEIYEPSEIVIVPFSCTVCMRMLD